MDGMSACKQEVVGLLTVTSLSCNDHVQVVNS